MSKTLRHVLTSMSERGGSHTRKPLHFEYIENIAKTSIPKDGGDMLNGFRNPDGRIDYTSLFTSQIQQFDDQVLLPFGDYAPAVAKEYWDALHTPGFIACGYMTLKDYNFFETCALPIDPQTGQSLMGEPICWGGDFAPWYAGEHDLEGVLSAAEKKTEVRTYISRLLKGEQTVENAVILSAPGQDIYGHWLLDFLPRLDILSHMDIGDLPIFADSVPPWAHYFLQCFGIEPSRLRKHPARLFKVRNALIPTSVKSGYRLGASALLKAWQRVSPPAPIELDVDLVGEKLFLSRRRWAHSTRVSVAHIDTLEMLAQSRGYKLIFPETLTIPQQIQLMQQARIVVGEDGSALHNIVFANPGACLGVISPANRMNLWHYGLCHVTGQRLAYYYNSSDTEAETTTSFHDFLDVLES